jgi:hypothetical protein
MEEGMADISLNFELKYTFFFIHPKFKNFTFKDEIFT